MKRFFDWQTRADWLLGLLTFLLCAVLTVLQYRWTGEIARSETARLRGSLDREVRAFARAFDDELSASCLSLCARSDTDSRDPSEASSLERYNRWKATNPRPLFSRIALATAAEEHVQLAMLDQDAVRFVRTNWPGEWSELHENLEGKLAGGSPPFCDESGLLVELPDFCTGPDPRPRQWLVLELNLPYLRKVWFPELYSNYLSSEGLSFNNARVQTLEGNAQLLYMAQPTQLVPRESLVSVRFNPQMPQDRFARPEAGPRAQSRRGQPPQSGDFASENRERYLPPAMRPGHHSAHGPLGEGHWLLEAWPRPGALEALVSASRWRNLGVAVVINLLLLGTFAALIRQTHMTRRLARAQMNFVANVSHELRTPLTVIRGAAQNMERGVVTERSGVQEYSRLIIQHSDHLTQMVEEVLAFAGAKNGNAAADYKPLPIRDVIQEAIQATAPEVKSAGCELQAELPPDLPEVSGDRAALRRVFQNLISNAAKHAGAGRWIGVCATADNAVSVEVRVSDHGPGIPAAEQPRIFDAFFRGARAQANQTRGSGLGLSLVREIVQAHHGTVAVSSASRQGAVFTIRLPAAAPKSAV